MKKDYLTILKMAIIILVFPYAILFTYYVLKKIDNEKVQHIESE